MPRTAISVPRTAITAPRLPRGLLDFGITNGWDFRTGASGADNPIAQDIFGCQTPTAAKTTFFDGKIGFTAVAGNRVWTQTEVTDLYNLTRAIYTYV